MAQYDYPVIMLLTSTTPQTSWWQTALASLIPAIGGAAVALLGVWLNGHLTAKREARQAAESDKARQLDVERTVIAELIATIFPWERAIRARFLAEWYDLHPRNGQCLKPEAWEKAQTDSFQFAAALWKARITVRNPRARETLNILTETYKEYSDFVDRLAETHDHSNHDEEDAKMDRLDLHLHELCIALEVAALAWDGE